MTPNTTPRSARRNAKTVAIGAVALTAAVALPAFAIDRGGDGAVDVATAADAVESTTTTTTIDPALAAWLEAKSVEQSLAALATLTPEQLFELQSRDWTPEQRASFAELAAQQAELESFYALVSWSTAQAEAARRPRRQRPGRLLRQRLGLVSPSARPVATGPTPPCPVGSPAA